MKVVWGVLLLSSIALGSNISLEELRMEKRFGIGMAAGGGFSVMGIEADVNLTDAVTISGGVGTGLDYSTFAIKSRYFLLGKRVSPYAGVGFSRWWSEGISGKKTVGPSVLANRFLDPGTKLEDGFSVFLLYPVLGVQYMHPLGIEFSLEVQYLFKMFNMASGTYAGLSSHYYF